MNGNIIFLFFIPGADKTLLVINKLTNVIVELIPENITPIIAISWAPLPVNFVFAEKGVINVQPDIVKEALFVFTTKVVLLFLIKFSLEKKYQIVSLTFEELVL